MANYVLPLVMSAHTEYYVYDEDITLCSSTNRYAIPYRAAGNKLRDIQFVDQGGSHYEFTLISIEDRVCYACNYTTSRLIPYYFEADEIVMLNFQRTGGNLRFSYFLTPNELVEVNRGAKISAICVGCCTTTFTLDAFPTHFSCTSCFDFVKGRSPHKIRTFDVAICSICSTTKTVTFDNCQLTRTVTDGLTQEAITFVVGDYITKSEETVLPQLPAEIHSILAQRTAIKLLEGLGDTEGMKNATEQLKEIEDKAMTLIGNRNDGSPKKINIKHSLLKSSTTNNYFRRRGN